MKKAWLAISGVTAAVTPIVAVVSCSTSSDASSMLGKLNYDFGLACPPINNLNYLRQNIGPAQDALVYPLVQNGPKGTLKNILQLPDLKLHQLKTDSTGNIVKSGRFYTLSQFSEYAAGLSDVDGSYAYLPWDESDATSPVRFVFMQLNDKIHWKGATDPKFNRAITAQDYVDGVKYMIDLNNGSQMATRILTSGIVGMNDVYNAQVEYQQAMNKTYSDPWGYNVTANGLTAADKYTHLKSENPGDEKYVARIESAARYLLTQGISVNDLSIDGKAPDKYALKIQFTATSSLQIMNFDSYIAKMLVPANKEFIESIGGIYQFGTAVDKFVYTSPFNVDALRLGQGGYIDLSKDTSFYSAKYTLANKIKIYFQEDPNILSSMFKDGYISGATISPTYLQKFWADPKIRPFMSKSQGFGTVALRFNLSKAGQTTPNAPKLDNPDLRLAVSQAINRNSYIKLAGWDSAAVTSLWNVKGTGMLSDGRAVDTVFENEKFYDLADIPANVDETKTPDYLAKHGVDLLSMNYNERTAIMYRFEHAERQDSRFDATKAVAHLDKYLKENGLSSVKLTFLCNGDQGVKQGLGLKSQFQEVFGSKVELEIKSVPHSSYDNMISHGEFDMSVDNFDKFGQDSIAYYKSLIWSDEIDSSINKTSGFFDNPTGSWTFSRFYERIKAEDAKTPGVIAKYKAALNINTPETENAWSMFVDLAEHTKVRTADNQNYIERLFAGDPGRDAYLNSSDLARLFVLFEKIIAVDAPIVPLYEVDTRWDVSRLVGISNLYSYDLQFAYDELKRPRANLPGTELK